MKHTNKTWDCIVSCLKAKLLWCMMCVALWLIMYNRAAWQATSKALQVNSEHTDTSRDRRHRSNDHTFFVQLWTEPNSMPSFGYTAHGISIRSPTLWKHSHMQNQFERHSAGSRAYFAPLPTSRYAALRLFRQAYLIVFVYASL